MAERLEQRYCIKFCQKLGETQAETIRKIQQAFLDESMSITQIKEWYNRFKEGRTSAESDFRSGRPLTCRNEVVINNVNELIMDDRRLTVREIGDELNISKDSAHVILTQDLGMHRVAAKFVPRLLSEEQRCVHKETAEDLLQTCNAIPDYLDTIITGDETWVYGYDPETKAQSSQWKRPSSPRPTKARQVRSKTKVMLTVFFDCKGIVHHEFAPENQTVTKEYYREVLRRLREAVRRKRRDLWESKNWRLHHDNAPAHSSQLVGDFLAKHGVPLVRQPPYSPGLSPADFWLFPKVKKQLKGHQFQTREIIMDNVTDQLRAIPEEGFQGCFENWKVRWSKCVDSDGAYFEGL